MDVGKPWGLLENLHFCVILRGRNSIVGYCPFGYQLVSQAGQLLRSYSTTWDVRCAYFRIEMVVLGGDFVP